jgi:CheY-like chemotaxis protein/anti-sigma regulatory factor (Ser/Thr protein kinase)
VEIESVVRSVSEEYSVLAEQKGIELHLSCSIKEGTIIITDIRVIRTILNNLVSNAVKYTPSGGEVYVTVHTDNQQLLISVSDTGRGIHPDDLPYLFDRYFQTNRPDTPLEGGTGIGLALVKELADIMNGRVTVESNPGKGSLFSVSLPLSAYKTGELATRYDNSTIIKQSVNRKRRRTESMVLLVEDNPDFQQYIDFLLNEYYQVALAGNGREALEMLKSGTRPDLVITDWMMPEMDGMQLSRILAGDSQLSDIPVIFLTARSGDYNNELAIRLGIDDYLTKPFDESVLYTTVDRLIERYRIRKEEGDGNKINLYEDKSEQKRKWLEKLQQVTLKSMGDELFSVDQLASAMLMGRTSFYKEVKRLTGLTPNDYILEARLMRARSIMEAHSDMTIKKVVKMVGLKDEGHFSRAFKKRFGNPPSWYL